MTEEQIEAIAKKLFLSECPSSEAWTGHNTVEWTKAVRGIVVALDNGVPLEQVAGIAARAYAPEENKDKYRDDWQRYTTFVVTEYLLTPKGE